MSAPSEVNPQLDQASDAPALRIVTALARLGGAGTIAENPPLVPIDSAQISGISYANIGQAGLDFLEEWARSGAKVRVPSYMNPAAIDLERWRELGVSEEFAHNQRRIVEALQRMGVAPSLTCTPYECYAPPGLDRHVAWSESSAVCVANSLFGARTNREGGPSALAAAICGFTARNGYHLAENRAPTCVIRVECALRSVADCGALGLIVGAQVGQGVPYFVISRDHQFVTGELRREGLKALAAAMAATGAVALFHVEGLTPEAGRAREGLAGLPVIHVDSLEAGYRLVNSACENPEVVALGCPHASYEEVERAAALVRGKQMKARLWICTSRYVFQKATRSGLKDEVERSGARLLADMCLVVAPLAELGISTVATNSAKTAYYLRSREGISVCYDSLEMCIDAAATGRWQGVKPSAPVAMGKPIAPLAPAKKASGSLRGIAIVGGRTCGEALCSRTPIGFFGHVNPATGVVTEPGHELHGQSIAGKILLFPRAKGSTVGSYVLYALKQVGCAPLAIVNDEMEPIVAAGAVIAEIPAVDGIDTSLVNSGQTVQLDGGELRIV